MPALGFAVVPPNDPPARESPPPGYIDPRRHWARGMVVGTIMLLVAVGFVADNALHNRRTATIGWAVVYTLAVLLLTHVMKHYRVVEQTPSARWTRTGLILGLIGAGVAFLFRWNGADDATGTGFLGLTITFLAVAWGVAELRESPWFGPRRGWWLLGGSVLLATGAVWLAPTDNPRLGLLGIAGALMVGQLGIVFASQQILRRSGVIGAVHYRRLALTGAVLTSVVAALFWVWAGPWHALSVVVATVVLTAFTTSRGEWDSIFTVLAFILIWALAPQTETLPDQLNPDPAGDSALFVVFGDSYISGEGASRFYDHTNTKGTGEDKLGNECRRSPTAWAPRLALDDGTLDPGDHIPGEMIFLACSGARAREIWEIDQEAQGSATPWPAGGQINQFLFENDALDISRIRFALVSIGGNDANFAKIGQACVLAGDCSEIAEHWLDALEQPRAFDPALPDDLSTLEAELVEVYHRIGDAVGGAPMVVVPYPDPLREAGCDFSMLTENEHRFISGYVRQLNAVVASAAAEAGAHLLQPMPSSLAGARICDDNKRAINFIGPSPISGSLEDSLNPINWLHNSFHPKPSGHELMAEAASAWFATTDLGATPAHVDPSGPHDVPDLESVMGMADVTHCGGSAPPGLCNYIDDPPKWSLIQLVRLARRLEPVMIILVLGAWLMSLPVIHHIEGGDSRDFAAPTHSRSEDLVHTVFRITGLEWLVGGFPGRN